LFQIKSHTPILKFARILLAILVSFFIFYKLFVAYNIDSLFVKFNRNEAFGSTHFLLLALILGLLNWSLEALKWRQIISKYEPVSFGLAIKAIFSGASLSIITPNNIGDFAGRVLHLQVLDKIKGSLATMIGHAAQVLVTCVFGAYALWIFGDTVFKQKWVVGIGITAISLAVFFYLNMGFLYKHLIQFKWFASLRKYADVFGDFSTKDLIILLFLSLFRYLIFTSQYLLLLYFYRVDISFNDAFSCLSGTFFVQTVVPSFLLLEIGLRGASALWFFSMFSSNLTGILLAAYSLWIINMLLPALIGLYFIYKVK
jgi:hypothetical protein